MFESAHPRVPCLYIRKYIQCVEQCFMLVQTTHPNGEVLLYMYHIPLCLYIFPVYVPTYVHTCTCMYLLNGVTVNECLLGNTSLQEVIYTHASCISCFQ